MNLAITLAGILVLAILAFLRWLFLRSRSRRNEVTDSSSDAGPRHFDTTMGELRDLREALGRASSSRSDQKE